MYYCVTTDISNDRARRHVVKLCKQAGLRRIQKSVFAGKTSKRRIKELETEVLQAIDPQTDALVIIPLGKKAWRAIRAYGQMPQPQNLVLKKGYREF